MPGYIHITDKKALEIVWPGGEYSSVEEDAVVELTWERIKMIKRRYQIPESEIGYAERWFLEQHQVKPPQSDEFNFLREHRSAQREAEEKRNSADSKTDDAESSSICQAPVSVKDDLPIDEPPSFEEWKRGDNSSISYKQPDVSKEIPAVFGANASEDGSVGTAGGSSKF